MAAVIIEHVSLDELPSAWRARLLMAENARVTIRIEEEIAKPGGQSTLTDNPMFGMWQDRAEMSDVADYVRLLRAPRYQVDGSEKED